MEIVKNVFSLIFGLILFIGILYLAYVSTKFIGKRYSIGAKGGKNLKLLETINVGRDMNIAIARAGERIFLLGITPDRINMLSELNEADLISPYEESEEKGTLPSGSKISFADALKYNINKKLGKDVSLDDYTQKQENTDNSGESNNE